MDARLLVVAILAAAIAAPVAGAPAPDITLPGLEPLKAARDRWAECLAAQVLEYGVGNVETGETVLKVARAYCGAEYNTFNGAWNSSHLTAAGRYWFDQAQEAAEGKALAGLIAARHPKR